MGGWGVILLDNFAFWSLGTFGWLVEIGREDLLSLGLNWFSIDSISLQKKLNQIM